MIFDSPTNVTADQQGRKTDGSTERTRCEGSIGIAETMLHITVDSGDSRTEKCKQVQKDASAKSTKQYPNLKN